MATLPRPLKWYKALVDKKARLEAGVFLMEGEKAIRQILGNHPEAVTDIIASGEISPDFRRYPTHEISLSQFGYISSTRAPQGIAAVVRIPADTYSTRLPTEAGNKILLLEDIQDPGNIGTLIRTAAAFDFSGIVLTGKCADPFSPKVVQATAGSIMSLWLRVSEQYLEITGTLRQSGYSLIATGLKGRAGPDVLHQEHFILALGNEAAGLSADLLELADYNVSIPIAPEKAESLNAAVCGGILMYLAG